VYVCTQSTKAKVNQNPKPKKKKRRGEMLGILALPSSMGNLGEKDEDEIWIPMTKTH